MSFWKKMFGLGGARDEAAPASESPPEIYNGFSIRAAPMESGGGFIVAGVISKTIDGEERTHRFIRADRLPSHESAVNMTLSKARQIIDLEGDRIFRER